MKVQGENQVLKTGGKKMSIKKRVTTIFLDDESGLEYLFEPAEDSLTVQKTKAGYTARYLTHDDLEEGPQEWHDKNLFIMAFHRDFWVEAPRVYYKLPVGVARDKDDKGHALFEKDELKAYFEGDKENYPDALERLEAFHVFPLEAYIHSGVRLALKSEGNFPDRQWDVSWVGAVLVSKEEWKDRKKARAAALGYVETWNQYLSGDIWCCVVETYGPDKVQIAHDTCSGFYGYEYALKELKNIALPADTQKVG